MRLISFDLDDAKAKKREYDKRYRETHRDYHRAKSKEWWAKNGDRVMSERKAQRDRP